MSADRWLNYADAAALLGMTPESIRQRARREHWRKQIGNEGKALVLVPLDAPRYTAGDAPDDAPASRPVKPPEPDPVPPVYLARISELEARASELREGLDRSRLECDRERDERLAERERAEKLTAELTDLAKRFAVSTDDARVREAKLTVELATYRDGAQAREKGLASKLQTAERELTELRDRPWWRRLMG